MGTQEHDQESEKDCQHRLIQVVSEYGPTVRLTCVDCGYVAEELTYV